jgi:hypothetical protein
MSVEWVGVGIVFAAGALLVGLPAGVAIGYAWRAAISRRRRLRHLVERGRRRAEMHDADMILARPSAQINAGATTDPVAKSTSKNRKRRKKSTKPKPLIATGNFPQEAGPNG